MVFDFGETFPVFVVSENIAERLPVWQDLSLDRAGIIPHPRFLLLGPGLSFLILLLAALLGCAGCR